MVKFTFIFKLLYWKTHKWNQLCRWCKNNNHNDSLCIVKKLFQNCLVFLSAENNQTGGKRGKWQRKKENN